PLSFGIGWAPFSALSRCLPSLCFPPFQLRPTVRLDNRLWLRFRVGMGRCHAQAKNARTVLAWSGVVGLVRLGQIGIKGRPGARGAPLAGTAACLSIASVAGGDL